MAGDIKFLAGYLLFAAACVIFVLIAKKPYLCFPVYYLGVFAQQNLLPGVRVRVRVGIQLALFASLLAFSFIGSKKRRNYPPMPKNPMTKGLLITLLAVVPLECILGYLNGYGIFHIIVDVYKVLEIVIYLFVISYTVRSRDDADRMLSAMFFEMCFLGFIEMFTKERGGVGLNMMVSYFPILLATGFYKQNKYFWIFACLSVVTVIICQTRTYILGIALGVMIVCLFGRGKFRMATIKKGVLLGVCTVTLLVVAAPFLGNTKIGETIQRFGALFSEGVSSEAGYRIQEIQLAVEKFKSSPLFGKGYGYIEHVYLELMGWFDWGDFMHNAYVEIFCKTGIYGSLVYAGGIIGFILLQIKKIREIRLLGLKNSEAVQIGGLAGTVSWLLIYAAAPLSSYGYIFISGIISLTYYQVSLQESKFNAAGGAVCR